MKAIVTKEGRDGEIPAELKEEADRYRQALMEAAAESDDDVIEKYLAGEPLTELEIWHGLKKGAKAGKIIPVLCGSATANLGVQSLMHAILELMPSPADGEPVEATNAATHQVEKLTPNSGRAARGLRVQDARRSICRQIELFPRRFRYAELGLPRC